MGGVYDQVDGIGEYILIPLIINQDTGEGILSEKE
jgi:hypothetical protein